MELGVYEGQQKNKKTVKSWITFFFIFFSAAVFAVFIVTNILQVNTVARFVCAQLALPTVKRARGVINAESFERLAVSLDKHDPNYENYRRYLRAIKEETGVLSLYTMAPADRTMYRYIIDGSTDPANRKHFFELGQTEDMRTLEAALHETVKTKNTGIGTFIKTKSQDYFTISVYEPVLKDSGELTGLVVCSIDASEIISWIRIQILWQLGIVLLLVVMGLTVYIALIRRVERSFG